MLEYFTPISRSTRRWHACNKILLFLQEFVAIPSPATEQELDCVLAARQMRMRTCHLFRTNSYARVDHIEEKSITICQRYANNTLS